MTEIEFQNSDVNGLSTDATRGRRDVVQDIDLALERVRGAMIEHFHRLHAAPELSWHEEKTAAYIGSVLESLGLAPRVVAGTGWAVDLPGDDSRPRRALRSDHDAVAIQESTDLPYASKVSGVMHACGHDAHTSILLAVAATLLQIEASHRPPIRLIFQPAEEALDSGAIRMLEEGVLDGVHDIIGLHVWPSFATGTVGLREGILSAAADCWECTLRGPGGHGARPHETADLVALAARIITGLTNMPRRVLDPVKQPAVVSATQMHGGHAFNVIPTEVRVCGTARTLGLEAQRLLSTSMEDYCRDVAAAGGAELTWTLQAGPPLLVNDPRLTRRARDLLSEMFGRHRVLDIEHPSLGSEDFSKFTERVPGMILRLGCTAEGQEPYPLHSSHFKVDEAALDTGVRALCRLALD